MRCECLKRPVSVARAEPGARGQLFGTGAGRGACAKEVKIFRAILVTTYKKHHICKTCFCGGQGTCNLQQHFWLKGGGGGPRLKGHVIWFLATDDDMKIHIEIYGKKSSFFCNLHSSLIARTRSLGIDVCLLLSVLAFNNCMHAVGH